MREEGEGRRRMMNEARGLSEECRENRTRNGRRRRGRRR